MNKGIGIAGLLLAIVAIVLSVIKTNEVKIAYVDNNYVIQNYNGVKEATDILERKIRSWDTELDTMHAQINIDLQDFQSKFATMSLKEKQLAKQLIDQKKQSYYQLKEQVDEKKVSEDHRMTQQILKQIDAFIEEFAKEKGYDYVLGLTDNGSILYGDPKVNITEEVLKGLNDKYEGK